MNSLNSEAVNAVPLSVTITSGNPWVANNSANLSITAFAEVAWTGETSSHLEWESTTIRKSRP
ncbi:hypothetical protein M513_09958 [Trichuris suis]|uniref:Uncharacterized protein n=1 Tax=Trichuris suis TaxID=68888 RepID=A0A085LVY8_9BILA|nr:hypothetical protein M513_09958 [Trichuris suis]